MDPSAILSPSSNKIGFELSVCIVTVYGSSLPVLSISSTNKRVDTIDEE